MEIIAQEEKYYIFHLDNGITVLIEPLPQFMSASVGVWVNSGSIMEKEEESGISHFIEHLLFKGTKNRTAKEISQNIDSVGGVLNASCGKEATCFFAKVVNKDIALAMDLLSDMLKNSLFLPEDIDKERKVIIEEINSLEDSPEDDILNLHLKGIWNNHPLAKHVAGDKKNVARLTREEILNYFKHFYTPQDIVISMAGDVEVTFALELVKKYFGDIEGESDKREIPPPTFNSIFQVKEKPLEQVHICLGAPGLSSRDERRYTLGILDIILGGSTSSRLFQEIREERALVYSIYSFQSNYRSGGILNCYAATSPENTFKVLDLIKREIEKIVQFGITKDELKRAQDNFRGGIILALENTSNRMLRLARSFMTYNRVIPIKEVLEEIYSVTCEKVQSLACELLKQKEFAVTILGGLNKG